MILFPSTGPHSGLIYENDGLYIRLMYSGCWKYFIRMMKCIFLGFFCKEDRNMDSHWICTFDSYTKHFFKAKASFVSCFQPLCSLQSNRIMFVDFAGRCTAVECWYIWSSIYWVQHPTISNLLQKQTRKTYENKYICHKVFSLSEVRQKW